MSTWSDRYKALKKDLRITNRDVADITGSTPDSVKSITSPGYINTRCPKWLKLAIVVYEQMKEINSH